MTETKSIIKSGDGRVRPLAISTIEEAWRYAKYIVVSGLAPNSLIKGKTLEQQQASIFAAIQLGAEVGLSPMAAVNNICVVNGKPGLYGDAQTGVIRSSGKLGKLTVTYEGEDKKDLDDSFKCIVTAERIENNGVINETTKEYSIADARRADLLGKDNWKKHTKVMLAHRAKTLVWRELFSDVLHGLTYTVEELMENMPMRDVTPHHDANIGVSDKANALNNLYSEKDNEATEEDCSEEQNTDDVMEQYSVNNTVDIVEEGEKINA